MRKQSSSTVAVDVKPDTVNLTAMAAATTKVIGLEPGNATIVVSGNSDRGEHQQVEVEVEVISE